MEIKTALRGINFELLNSGRKELWTKSVSVGIALYCELSIDIDKDTYKNYYASSKRIPGSKIVHLDKTVGFQHLSKLCDNGQLELLLQKDIGSEEINIALGAVDEVYIVKNTLQLNFGFLVNIGFFYQDQLVETLSSSKFKNDEMLSPDYLQCVSLVANNMSKRKDTAEIDRTYPETVRPRLAIAIKKENLLCDRDLRITETKKRIDGFKCKFCGKCCNSVLLSQTVPYEDILEWENEEPESDVLRYVHRTRTGEDTFIYDAWIDPDTLDTMGKCPFLKKNKKNQHKCILPFDKRPESCRLFPTSREEAEKIGCEGYL